MLLMFSGKMGESLPHFSEDPTIKKRNHVDGAAYIEHHCVYNTKCTTQESVCFDGIDHSNEIRRVGSVAVTSNHWSDPF